MQTDKLKLNKWFVLLLFAAIILCIGAMILGSGERKQNDFLVVTTFFINIFIFLWNLSVSIKKHSFGFDMIFWVFHLFFFGFAPLLQYYTREFPWMVNPTVEEIVRANFYILLWVLIYQFGRTVLSLKFTKHRSSISELKRSDKLKSNYTIDQSALNILLVISSAILLYFLATIGFSNMIFRSTNYNEEITTTTAYLLTTHVFKNILLFTFLLHMVDAQEKKRISIGLLISGFCFLLCCFPTGLARNMMASFYAGVFILFLNKKSQSLWISILIVLGLTVVFPAIDVFRYANESNFSISQAMKESIQNTYLTGDYDAYTMLIAIDRYVRNMGLSYGMQLLGAILFFVPRTVWPSKPIGSGHTVFKNFFKSDFTNVSAPLISEGFINFGFVGIIIFALLCGILCKLADDTFWKNQHKVSISRVLYPPLVFQFFFLLRGDLMSGGSYFLAQLLVGLITCLFAIRKVRESTPSKYTISNKYRFR